jgi:hypothetical protein
MPPYAGSVSYCRYPVTLATVAHPRLAALALVLCPVVIASCSAAADDASTGGTTTPTGWHNGTCSRDCSFKLTPISGTSTPSGEKAQLAIEGGCLHLAQLKKEVSEALDSGEPAARLESTTSGAAWKAVSEMGPAAGLSGTYQQFIVDEAVLNGGYAAAISGGPTTSLKGALSKLSTDCQKVSPNSP